ncbi:class I SAM-dependent methyltransferase [Candidatus Pelagibacter sp. FZCC0015]|uniref:class I SAM-dependent methyltransferase n=1 Tax=Candidatus Pelagibacter sp. FZCC0015 TaxID=2268451 RepID=UPI0011A02471|nr:class I SAM-dependent methyltransferase [Candidatus Pelagibacter sp. FZCC0015]
MNNLLLKLIRNLIRPHKIPKKIFNKLNYYFNFKKYNQNFFEKEQNDIFKYFGLNREEGIKKLTLIKKELGFKSRDSGMSSEHEVIFSSLSLSKNKSITDILEIGTFDGFNALLLSNLFPNSNIDTIDLPENDDDFINFYNRKDNIIKFIQDRNIILSKNKNINYSPLNSLKLLNYKKKYDLIWIDGAHGYPVVCIDIINSLNILKENGLILCDDVHLKLNQSNSDIMYSSIATYETLNELKKEDLINFRLIYKRLGAEHNCIENERKFVAIVSKI